MDIESTHSMPAKISEKEGFGSCSYVDLVFALGCMSPYWYFTGRVGDSSSPEYWKAITDLGRACDAQKVSWVLLGGTACASLGSPRTTQDIDIVAHSSSSPGTEVDLLKKALPGRLVEKVDQYGCPEMKMDGIEVDIFDPTMWPQRKYMDFVNNPFQVKAPGTSQIVNVPHPSALLEEKMKAAEERANNKKGANDKIDVAFLSQCTKDMGGLWK
ncbi:hypothetical protein C0991_002560 [Blastosporella zonata]|nr:hypothetical protein C0991_002560 [Blastosporella zonata]